MNNDVVLRTFHIEASVPIAQANPGQSTMVTLNSSALAVMTDLTKIKAASIHPSSTLRQAEQMMIYQGVRMLFVVTDMPSIEGLITFADLHGDKQMRVVHDRHMYYADLCVADVMSGLAGLDAIEFERLQSATISDLIATLKHLGHDHLLVVQRATAQSPRQVRGVISRAQIERQLGHPLEIMPVANSFAEIEQALA
ncbi:CBS domain-containing protein [Sphaerotilus sp.]|uniref:CBS domain-containing protein n=1 Tax=Sphaerotilus sp. TaxID=2093942 RepID=UPI0034E28265